MNQVSIQQAEGRRKARTYIVMAVLAVLIIICFVVSMSTGQVRLTPIDMFKTLVGLGTAKQEMILFDFRLPRIVIAVLVGAGLAVSGAILQGVSRNGLADPGLMGINAGAGFAVAAYLMVFAKGGGESVLLLPFVALLGAFSAAGLIYLVAWKNGVTPIRLILVGIGVGLAFAALMILLSIKMDPHTYLYVEVWLAGSIWGSNWTYVAVLLPWIFLLLPFAMYKAGSLNILGLGDQAAAGLGTAVEKERLILLCTSVALAGSCVSIGGGIGFIGLVAPHLARQLVGPRHERMLPATALLGSLLLLVSDFAARNLMAPSELPTGIVVAVIGAPYFLYLLARSKA
ncbi:iron ABC transporter permease [Brevibacillus ruminantium]|uniref:Iron ABC transporter permease n=1 Tax=Brevibacillus ruminantium TaxID=2950604 RepID=A0ABY4WK02_9BACL|nr:iron ABC transporter permease [Brevibacillus ruminantium]USG66190.1 iron ABC transporter permease [Brevibacillus ruminantium]